MNRANVPELLEDPTLPADVVAAAYRNLASTQRFLGNTRAIFRQLRKHRDPIHLIVDIGCGQGALLEEIQKRLGVDVIGFDLRPAPSGPVRILTGNATVDPLPRADVALAVCVVHHLSEAEIIALIRNVSKSCRRLILLDLVRHWIPLTLFRVFVAPFLHRINAVDGLTSIKRAYTPRELREIVDEAVKGSGASVDHIVALFYVRQVIDIEFKVN
jgi:2-polyprenyl-3-methyl-5-hydroxy-6-metoxy-1,4-benzoquinol methylase